MLIDGLSLGQFEPGDQLVFPGAGVAAFTVRGILPPDDLADGADFPLRIAFDTPTADSMMTPIPVPEPTSLTLAAAIFWGGLLGGIAVRRWKIAPSAANQ